jgi:hypothetical protein
MTWGRLDDKLHDHRKSYKAGTAAMGLWVMANSWCCDNWKSDGFIPTRILQRFADSEYDVEDYSGRLVSAGLWIECEVDGEPGYRFHDWQEMRPTSEKDALGGTFGNHMRWHVKRDITSPDCEHCDPAISRDDLHEQALNPVAGIAPRIAPVAVAVPDPVAETRNTRARDLPPVFAEFVDAYPGDVHVKPAMAAWTEAVRRTKGRPEDIIRGAFAYAEHFRKSGKEARFVRNAVKWLNEDGWLDKLQTIAPAPSKSTTDNRVGDAFALADQLRAQEEANEPPTMKAIGR